MAPLHGSDRRLEALRHVSLLSGLSRRELERVATLAVPLEVKEGRVLTREGERGAEFFVILEGQVSVSAGGRDLGRLGAGQFFGELALLDGGPRLATVVATEATRLLVLNRAEFSELLDEVPSVARHMLPTLGAWVRQALGGATPAA